MATKKLRMSKKPPLIVRELKKCGKKIAKKIKKLDGKNKATVTKKKKGK